MRDPMRYGPMIRLILLSLLLFIAIGCRGAAPRPAASIAPHAKPFLADTYLDLIRTYVDYSRSIWHEDAAGAGGYWGDGIDAKNQNGAVRGMCNTLLGHAMLVYAMDRGWIEERTSGDKGGLKPA